MRLITLLLIKPAPPGDITNKPHGFLVNRAAFCFSNTIPRCPLFRFSISELPSDLCTCHLSCATHYWQYVHHENIYIINHSFVRGIDCDFIACTKPSHIACDCSGSGPTRGCNRRAKSAGDDETDDGAVEAQ